jgi:hypothetical protein
MKNKNQIIQRLQDDSDYYGEFGRKFLSNSDIGVLLANPKDYRKRRDDSKALLEGRYFHQLLIEPDKAESVPFVDASTRNTNIYKNFIAESGLEIALLQHEKENIERLVSVMKANIHFYDEIYRPVNQYEVPEVKEVLGQLWKGKADIVSENILIDLKTTGDIHRFKYSARAYNYDSQAWLYEQLFGKPLVFYVIDKETAQLGVFRPTEEFLMFGKQKVEQAIEVYNRYFGPTAFDSVDNHYIEMQLL